MPRPARISPAFLAANRLVVPTIGGTLLDAWLAYPGYLFTDAACSTPVTAAGQAIQGIKGYTGALGNLTQATGANCPLFDITSGFGGLLFDGINDSMSLTFAAALSQPITWFVISEKQANGSPNYIFDGVGAGDRHILANSGSTPNTYYTYEGVGYVGGTAIPVGINAVALAANGASTTIRGAGISETGNGGTMQSGGITLGSFCLGSNYFSGIIRGLLSYSGAMSTTDQDTVLAWLRTTFGAA